MTGLHTGQRVLAVLRNGGGYAEEILLDAATVVPIPDAMDFVTAAAFPVAYGTSYFALIAVNLTGAFNGIQAACPPAGSLSTL